MGIADEFAQDIGDAPGDSKLLGRPVMWKEPHHETTAYDGKRVVITGGCGYIGRMVAMHASIEKAEQIDFIDNCEIAVTDAKDRFQFVKQHVDVKTKYQYHYEDAASPRAKRLIAGANLVIHCAAMKHVDICETSPAHAVYSNVAATMNIADAALEHGADMVLVSTDKATIPHSIMGKTKRIAEAVARVHRCGVVRLANVIGSYGSVLHKWKLASDSKRPVIITDPKATRYYIAANEAAYTIAIAADWAETRPATFVFNAGDPISTGELYKRFFGTTPENIKAAGLRPGEVRHESLYRLAEKPVARVESASGVPILWELTHLDDGCIEHAADIINAAANPKTTARSLVEMLTAAVASITDAKPEQNDTPPGATKCRSSDQ